MFEKPTFNELRSFREYNEEDLIEKDFRNLGREVQITLFHINKFRRAQEVKDVELDSHLKDYITHLLGEYDRLESRVNGSGNDVRQAIVKLRSFAIEQRIEPYQETITATGLAN